MRTTEMVLFAHFLKTSKFIPACISIYILSLMPPISYVYWILNVKTAAPMRNPQFGIALYLFDTYWGTLSSRLSCICSIHVEEPWVQDWVVSVRYILRNTEFKIELYLFDTCWGTLSSRLSGICSIQIEEPWVQDWVVSVRYIVRDTRALYLD